MNILSLVALALPVQAEIVQFTERPFDRQLVCTGISRPIAIDGKLDEWAGIPETEINLAVAKEVGKVDPKIDSDADCSASFRVAWDASNFYFSADVTADAAVAATAKTSKPWWCDSLQLYFRSTAEGRDTGRFRDKATFKPLTYPFFGVSLTTEKTRNKFLPSGCNSIGRVTEGGWQVEAAIPWAAMGYDVRASDAVRFAIVLVDNDPDPKSKWGQLIWMWNPHGSDDGRYWAKMRLGVKDSGLGASFHLTAESTKGRGEVRAQVDAARAAKLEKLHVADGTGKTVDEVPLGREVNAGTTTTVETSFRLPADRKRKCRLVLSFSQDKNRYSIEKEFIPAELSARSPTKGSQAYLNRFVTVDEKRASRKTQKLPRYEKTTRNDYLEVVNLFFNKRATSNLAWLKLPQPYPNLQANLHQARYFAFDFRVTRREESARHAIAFINQAHWLLEHGDPEKERNVAPNYHSPNTINRIWSWLKGSKAFTDKTRAQLREILLGCMPSFPERVEHGNFNRPFGMALRGQILLHYVPDAPDREKWQAYINRIWDEFWQFKDTDENSGNYNALWLLYFIDWAELRGESEKVFADQGIQKLLRRFMLQVLPVGTLPHYGDTTGWNVEWGHWIAIFELGARASGDGRFRWAAHRLYQYGNRRIEDIFSWGYTGENAARSLMLAYLFANERIQPIAPKEDVKVLDRQNFKMSGPEFKKKHNQSFILQPGRIPSKLMFRSDDRPDSLAMMLDLEPPAGHSPGVAPAIVAMVDRGATLLMDQGYMERETEDHNTVWLEDYEGIPLLDEPERITVLKKADNGPLAYAKVKVQNYKTYPVDLTRTVVFAKPGAVLIRDTLQFHRSFRARAGPVYNMGVLGPEIGTNWVNGYVGDWIVVKGIGPNMPIYTRWSNPGRDLMIYFPGLRSPAGG